MRIALSQLNFHIGNFDRNTSEIISKIKLAKDQKADIVVFAELAICGYPPRDFLDYSEFIDRCEKAVQLVAAECRGIACIVGAPSRNAEKEGKALFNSAFFLEDGIIKYKVDKSLLPTYDIFDEYRHFEPGKNHVLIPFQGKKIALTICEDLWNISENPLYTFSPMDELIKGNPDIMINIAASPFDYQHEEKRKKLLRENAKKYQLPLIYVNHIGAQTELIFDGGSMIFDAQGNIEKELNYFEEDFFIKDMEKEIHTTPFTSFQKPVERIYHALVLGIRDYFKKAGFTKAVLGLSGGIDSALTACLACEALGSENVMGILMPSQFSSDHSVADAEKLAENLAMKHETISIHNINQSFLESLMPFFDKLPEGLAEENLQARIRGTLLMAWSNKFGHILLNTSNKSEMAVGYGTLYGDMSGGLSVLGDVYKTQVYELAHFINQQKEIIPVNTIDKAPSAELRPHQKDSDSLPDYEVLDAVLFRYIEEKESLEMIKSKGFDEYLVKRIINMVNSNEYKRFQAAPILRISPKSFGMGRRMPIEGKYFW